jgi:predicted nuclease with TOPRIM domain
VAAAKPKRLQRLDEINIEIRERTAYLGQINADIDMATLAGSDRIREISGEISQLEEERARLLTLNLGLEQKIRWNKQRIAVEKL